MATTTDVYTFRDYLNTVREDQKAHLLDGIIAMESPASMRHEELQAFLSFLLVGFVSHKQLGKVFGSKAAFRLKGHNAVEPDVVFVANDRLELATTNYFNGPPVLAVEIVSKGTRKLDYEQKKPAYERAGTREMWIIDYLRIHADFFVLTMVALRRCSFREIVILKVACCRACDWMFSGFGVIRCRSSDRF